MPLDTVLFYTGLMVFVRTGALFFTAPVFSNAGIPIVVRTGLSGIIALALAPTLRDTTGALPPDLLTMVGALGREAFAGLIMGFLVMALFSAAEVAGHYLDAQIGFNMINVLNPHTHTSTTLLAGFKMQLAIVLFLILNGHHLLLEALVGSYRLAPAFGMLSLAHTSDMVAGFIGQVFVIAIQIAAPAAAALIVADMALAAVSRAVPQMNVFIVGAPAKVVIGLMSLAVGLPALAWGVSNIISTGAGSIEQILRTAPNP